MPHINENFDLLCKDTTMICINYTLAVPIVIYYRWYFNKSVICGSDRALVRPSVRILSTQSSKPRRVSNAKARLTQNFSWWKLKKRLTCKWGQAASKVGSSSSGSYSAPAGLAEGGRARNMLTENYEIKISISWDTLGMSRVGLQVL